MKYAHENGCEYDEKVCECSSLNGHIKCLRYAHENMNCVIDVSTFANAASEGHFKCLKYIHKNISTPNIEIYCNSLKSGYLLNNDKIIKNRYIKCIKYLHENGCQCNNFHLILNNNIY